MPDRYPLKILYVEDNPQERDATLKILSRYFLEVITAEDGEEGYSKYIEYSPDVVITDIGMPVMDGVRLCQRLRDMSERLPIILATGSYPLASVDTKGVRVDFQIEKPFDRNKLIEMIIECGRILGKLSPE